MKIQQIGKRVRQKSTRIAIVLSIFAVAFSTLQSNVVLADLSTRSPSMNDVSASGAAGGVSHIIKKETVANVDTLRLAAYYPASGGASGAGKELHIRYGVDGKKCPIVKGMEDRGYVYVALSSGGETRRYQIPMSNVCDNVSGRNNVVQGLAGQNNNKFFADYAMPNRLDMDDDSGLYKVSITIGYSDNVREGKSDENSVNFVTIVDDGVIGPLKNTSTNELGYRSAYYGDDRARNVVAAAQFGIPCSETKTDFPVSLYDPDESVFGDTYLSVTEDGKTLPKERYGSASRAAWDNGKKAFISTGAGSDRAATITVIGAQKNKTYKFIVRNDITSGKYSPNSNVISLGIPYDSIYSQVKCNYDLNPYMQITSDKTYAYEPNVSLNAGVNAASGSVGSVGDHPWETYAVRYTSAPNTNLTNADVNPSNACAIVPAPNRKGGCELITSSTYPATKKVTPTYANGGPDTVGTYLCFFTRVKNPTEASSDDNAWRYSDMSCAISGIKPKVQVLGYDLRSFGMVKTSTSKIEGKTYGSWGEYGIFSNGRNVNMASGAGLNSGSGASNQSEWSNLTFANIPTFGSFNAVTKPAYQVGTTTDTLVTGSLGGASYGSGTKKVIRYNGNLTITGDQSYSDGPYDSIADIPNVKIVANNITIAPNVKRIDAWLVAVGDGSGDFGKISTCSTIGFQPMSTVNLLDSKKCTNQLVINAPVVADQLYLYRTYDTPTGDPAEKLNLRASNFLSSYVGKGSDRPVARTELLTDLPPRF